MKKERLPPLLARRLIGLARLNGRRRADISALHELLLAAGQLRRVRARDLFALLPSDLTQTYRAQVNAARKKLRAAPLDEKAPRAIAHTLASLFDAEAFRLARRLGKTLPPRQAFRLWKEWVLSERFLQDSVWSPNFDECADLLLQLDEREMKRRIRKRAQPRAYAREQIYLDLTPEELFTPYRVLRQLQAAIPPGAADRFVDLGCGWGRAGFLLLASHPRASFTGYELVSERARGGERAARRAGLGKRFEMRTTDLSAEGMLADGEYYFLFNPFTGKTLRRVWKKLRPKSHRPYLVTVLFGQPYHQLKRAPWVEKSGPPRIFEWAGKGYQRFRMKSVRKKT